MAKRTILILSCVGMVGLAATQCGPAQPVATSAPNRAPLAVLLPTATLTPTPTAQPVLRPTSSPTEAPTPVAPAPTEFLPTATGMPLPSPTESLPTDTPTRAPPTEPAPPVPTATARPPQPTATPLPTPRPLLAAQQGGEWDMEAGFAPGRSPLGEDCPGWAVAIGWQSFLAPGDPASSCLNENKNPDNVRSGQRSQEITFDFISAEAGITHQAQTVPGHRYRIEAWGKHIRSASPVELFLGVDLNGGQDWRAALVTWHPWDETQEDAWAHTQVVVQAGAETLTLFLKGYHPLAMQGGATLFDGVLVLDLGL